MLQKNSGTTKKFHLNLNEKGQPNILKLDLASFRFNIPALEQLFSSMSEKGFLLKDYQGDIGIFEESAPVKIIYKLPFDRDVDNSTAESYRFRQGVFVCTNKKYAVSVFTVSAEKEMLCATAYRPQQLKWAAALYTLKKCVLPIMLCVCVGALLTMFWNLLGSVVVVFGAAMYSIYAVLLFSVVFLGTLKTVLLVVDGIRNFRGIGRPFVQMQSFLKPYRKKRIMGIACAVLAAICLFPLLEPVQVLQYNPYAQTSWPAPALTTFVDLNGAVGGEQSIELAVAKTIDSEGFQSTLDYDAGETGTVCYSVTYWRSANLLKLNYVYTQSKRHLISVMPGVERAGGMGTQVRRGIQVIEDGYFCSLVQTDTSVLEIVVSISGIPEAELVSGLPDICRELQLEFEQKSVLEGRKAPTQGYVNLPYFNF